MHLVTLLVVITEENTIYRLVEEAQSYLRFVVVVAVVIFCF